MFKVIYIQNWMLLPSYLSYLPRYTQNLKQMSLPQYFTQICHFLGPISQYDTKSLR